MSSTSDALAHRVFLTADDLSSAALFPLLHPRTDTRAMFARTAGRLLEVQQYRDKDKRSWLLGGLERVQPGVLEDFWAALLRIAWAHGVPAGIRTHARKQARIFSPPG